MQENKCLKTFVEGEPPQYLSCVGLVWEKGENLPHTLPSLRRLVYAEKGESVWFKIEHAILPSSI